MPGPPQQRGDALLEAARRGDVPVEAIDRAVHRILTLIERARAFDEPALEREESVDRPEHRALARRAVTESIVLLRNEAQILPLDSSKLAALAVIGPNASIGVIEGGGSARVNPHYAVSPLEGIRARCGDAVDVRFERGCTNHKTLPALDARHVELRSPDGGAGWLVEYHDGLDLDGEPVASRNATSSEFFWLGPIADGIDPVAFSARMRTHLTPSESGRYSLSLSSVGLARLEVDGVLVLDDTHPMGGGETFFGLGSPEVRVEVEWEAGRKVELTLEYRRQGAPVLAGLILGCGLPEPDDLVGRAVACAANADAAVVIVGLNRDWESEGHDRADMELPGRQVELIEAVAAANERTIVVINAGAPISMDWAQRVPAVLTLWYPGQECGNGLADVLFGAADPGGRLPTTVPIRLEDTPAYLNYPGENGHVLYGEGIFVGYRGYDARGIEPRYAFGHGLSYARFDYGPAQVETRELRSGQTQKVSVDVTNTGDRPGLEVVQLYLCDVESRLVRPDQELAAFVKVSLEPGETRRLELDLEPRALSYWDPAARGWVAEPGEFEVRIGRSSRDIRSRVRFRLEP
jgi:beta-glucosidase